MLALIKNNPVLNRLEIIGQFNEGGWADLPDGSRVAPASDGWELRGYELRTIMDADPVPEGYSIAGTTVEIVGARPKYINQIAPAVPVVPDEISQRQFFQALAERGDITLEEALAAVTTGTLPAEIEAMVEQILDVKLQWEARMLLAGARTFMRNNAFVEFFGAMKGMTRDDLDAMWRQAFALD